MPHEAVDTSVVVTAATNDPLQGGLETRRVSGGKTAESVSESVALRTILDLSKLAYPLSVPVRDS